MKRGFTNFTGATKYTVSNATTTLVTGAANTAGKELLYYNGSAAASFVSLIIGGVDLGYVQGASGQYMFQQTERNLFIEAGDSIAIESNGTSAIGMAIIR